MKQDSQIIGIGTDIEKVKRFEKLPFNKNKNFYRKIFTNEEIEECLAKPAVAQSFAARFAAKEAVIKGVNAIAKLSFRDIIIITGRNNAPEVKIKGKGKEEIRAHVSLSHTEEHALAFAIILKNGFE